MACQAKEREGFLKEQMTWTWKMDTEVRPEVSEGSEKTWNSRSRYLAWRGKGWKCKGVRGKGGCRSQWELILARHCATCFTYIVSVLISTFKIKPRHLVTQLLNGKNGFVVNKWLRWDSSREFPLMVFKLAYATFKMPYMLFLTPNPNKSRNPLKPFLLNKIHQCFRILWTPTSLPPPWCCTYTHTHTHTHTHTPASFLNPLAVI